MIYINKNGEIFTGILKLEKTLVINPTHAMLCKAGYKAYTENGYQLYLKQKRTNEEIKSLREQAYKAESDSLYIAWQKYQALNLNEKALEAKEQWLAKVNEIDQRYPYKQD